MKNLLIILIVVFGSIYFVACGDSVDSQEQHQDYVADQNLDTPEDAPDDSISLDVIDQVDALADWDTVSVDVSNQPEESEEPNQLPSDPTEDPDQESSFYEFPAWHIPPPSK